MLLILKVSIMNEVFYFTPAVMNSEEAIETKLRRLRGNFFGKPIMNFETGHVRNVMVPYCYVVYDYKVGGGKGFLKMSEKTGEIAVVFDMNETHLFQYDVYEGGHLHLEQGVIDGNVFSLMDSDISDPEILRISEEYIQHEVMNRSYGLKGGLRLKTQKRFYRPAVEIEVIYKGKNSNMRYAYLDGYSVESEHVSGMKHRLNNKS